MKTIQYTLATLLTAMIGVSVAPAFADEKKVNKFDPTLLTLEDSDSRVKNDRNGRRQTKVSLTDYAQIVNDAEWSLNMKANTAMTVKIQVLLDQNHVSIGAVDGGWGNNSRQALASFQQIKGLPVTGRMDAETWQALKDGAKGEPILVNYTITKDDLSNLKKTPNSVEARSKLDSLGYEDVYEKLAERFHMRINYLKKINPNKRFVVGETITVVNTGQPLEGTINRLVANTATNTLSAYHNDKLVTSYPATIGNTQRAITIGDYHVVEKTRMPHYKAVVTDNNKSQSFTLPPGANNPIGVAWIALNKSGYGIHGMSNPEIVGQLTSSGVISLTNWDVLELYANLADDATVEIK